VNKHPLITLNVSNPSSFSGKGSIIILEYTEAAAAMKAARKIATEMRRSVTVKDEDGRVIATVPCPSLH
jgi:hypothetical protein